MDFTSFLKDFCGQFEDENIQIGETEKFRETALWDSLTGIAVLYMIEKNYEVEMPVEDFLKLETPREIFEYIGKRKKL
jgi:acyl carrier protein